MAGQNKTLDQIKRVAIRVIPDSTLYLFGSRAKSNFDTNSDFDILIVTQTNYSLKEKAELKSKIRKSLAALRIPVDILINSQAERNVNQSLHGHIIRSLVKEMVAL
ncbi:MAG: nucleotidyltransferase domain-containing protein [Bacteroidetes bacterium]|nr:nucleotidyltransferase domain-containing protein [Bacteroidota bacterium]